MLGFLSMEKTFDQWNALKQKIHTSTHRVFAHPREVWWCSLGINIGSEMDGKHENFERPVLVLRVYNKETLLVLPITSKERVDPFHQKIVSHGRTVWVTLTQIRVVSSKRLLRKVDTITTEEFSKVKTALVPFL
jgi:mRNA interferase MazF